MGPGTVLASQRCVECMGGLLARLLASFGTAVMALEPWTYGTSYDCHRTNPAEKHPTAHPSKHSLLVSFCVRPVSNATISVKRLGSTTSLMHAQHL